MRGGKEKGKRGREEMVREVKRISRSNLNKGKENDHGLESLILLKWQYYPNSPTD